MKTLIKFILSFVCYVILIPLLMASIVCATWYVLPDFQTTILGEWVGRQLPEQTMFIASCVVAGSILVFFAFSRIFRVIKNSKPNNFYTHIVTWLLALEIIAISLFTLFTTNTKTTATFEFNMMRKIGIAAGGVLLLLYGIISPKIRRVVDRKIQAYDTAKELNANGRSSVVWVQILKALDFCYPELVLMGVLCFTFNIQIAIYFIYIIIAFILPIMGNMICDVRVRKEAIRKEQEKAEAQVNATAEAVAELLQQRG